MAKEFLRLILQGMVYMHLHEDKDGKILLVSIPHWENKNLPQYTMVFQNGDPNHY